MDDKQKHWNQIENQFWKYYHVKPKSKEHLAAINNYLEGLTFGQAVIKGKQDATTFELCWFCNSPLQEEGMDIDPHHILSRKNSFHKKIVHKECHIQFHKHWKLRGSRS